MSKDWIDDEELSFADKMKKFAELSPSKTVGPERSKLDESSFTWGIEDLEGGVHTLPPRERRFHLVDVDGSCECGPMGSHERGKMYWYHYEMGWT